MNPGTIMTRGEGEEIRMDAGLIEVVLAGWFLLGLNDS